MIGNERPREENAVSATEIASLLRVSRSTVYMLAEAGTIPSLKVGGRWRFFRSEVIEKLRVAAPGTGVQDFCPANRRLEDRRRLESEAVERMREVMDYLAELDPAGQLSQEQAAAAMRARFPRYR